MTHRNRLAFTLVELSIVLVILGLLVGGVLSGQSLIRAAELRAITTEHDRYVTAVRTFRDKYFAIPGDMTNATAFWGKNNTACAGNTGAAATPGTCNGNGDGVLNDAAGPNATGESNQFWNQLALAGLVEGSYTGLSNASGATGDTIGINAPKSRVGGGGWSAHNRANWAGDPVYFAFDYANYLVFGAYRCPTCYADGMLLKPEEAWNIDTKMDDGKALTGMVIGVSWSTCTTSTSATDTRGVYALTLPGPSCALGFAKQF